MDNHFQNFNKSLQTGFIDKSILSNLQYQPELLINQKTPPLKVLTSLLYELESCTEFFISVAFVTTSGVAAIINTLESLEKKGIKGKMLVSQYLNFTQPEALRRLLQFRNIELRISINENTHTKGYIFKNKECYNLIIGSSNLTAQALATNKEWNIKVSALDKSSIVDKVRAEFFSDFEKGLRVTPTYIVEYEKTYLNQLQKSSSQIIENNITTRSVCIPNTMQKEALNNLQKLRLDNKTKALIISATGTGKTYLSAFDAKNFNPKKLLFVVHRLTIAKNAMETFRKVFGNEKTMGLFSGNIKDLECDFIFSTVQTISKSNHLNNFKSNEFEYIIIDETHRSGAESYLRILDYFKPKFLLGMTATPERTDGYDIFSHFDHNIAYEIRLSKALEEDMLSPFHYYGVADLTIDGVEIDNKANFRHLIANERVERIIEKAKFYGSDNGNTRGLIFCSRKDEAFELSELFNKKGYKTLALIGDSTDENRSQAIELLDSDNIDQKLDYIFTVDIFNEGIDIPKINQIIMLRPTKSAIIFIQQLGRGLRKADGKSYLTVIDFIGNYENNYLIPIALYGDTSYNKDSIRKLITEGSKMIPGSSTINFDEITKQRIFESIDSANMQLYAELKNEYFLLKYKLGRIPMMMDYIEHGSRDPYLFASYSKSYYNFVVKTEKDSRPELSQNQIKLLELFSLEINNGKRVEESLILKLLIEKQKLTVGDLKKEISKKYSYTIQAKTIESCIENINFKFVRKEENILLFDHATFQFHDKFIQELKNPVFKTYLKDSINYSIYLFDKNYDSVNYKDGLVLYNKYSRKDVCRLLNWEQDISSTVYGYRTKNAITPCFITYHKSNEINNSIKYNDYFLDQSTFIWESKSNRKIGSKEINNIIDSIRILLFVKRDDKVDDFYYLGDVSIMPDSIKQGNMSKSNQPVVHFTFQLHHPVIKSLYQYITNEKITHEIKPRLISNKHEQKSILIESVGQLNNPIKLFNFYAAAGSFDEINYRKDYTFIEGPENCDPENYFAIKITGESMNRIIPNGSICLFKYYTGGSRNGKIVLIENYDNQDPDFNSAFAVKIYTSEKSITDETWSHEQIVLKPNSYDKSYSNIIIDSSNAGNMKIIGEFVKILK